MFSNLFGGIFDSSTVTVIPVYQFLLCVVVSLLLGIVLAAAYTYKSKYNAGFVRTLAKDAACTRSDWIVKDPSDPRVLFYHSRQ